MTAVSRGLMIPLFIIVLIVLSVAGTLAVYTEPGIFGQWFGMVTEYKQAGTYSFTLFIVLNLIKSIDISHILGAVIIGFCAIVAALIQKGRRSN